MEVHVILYLETCMRKIFVSLLSDNPRYNLSDSDQELRLLMSEHQDLHGHISHNMNFLFQQMYGSTKPDSAIAKYDSNSG
jgi:hypothetical protein